MRKSRLAFATALALVVAGCQDSAGGGRDPADREAVLAEVDTVVVELGGEAAARLDRGQRWRMISSVGAGLPPPIFQEQDLPEPTSRGAQLLRAYCVQCHGIPAPQMHSAAEWPILMRRMQMRATTLHDRMGGPMTRELLGEVLLSGMASAVLPSAADADTLLAYLERHAMPAAAPGELGTGPEAERFVQRCGTCHEAPAPGAHTPDEWEEVVGRMRANMAVMSVKPLTDEEVRRVLAFLEERAGAAR